MFLSESEIRSIGFAHLGNHVKIGAHAIFYSPERVSIGDHSRIDDYSILLGEIRIGRYVHIAPHCLVSGSTFGVEFEDFSGLSSGCRVFAATDDYSGAALTNPTVPQEFTNVTGSKVTFGRHVIVGANSVVLPGVNLAEGCSFGAMSLVNRSTEDWGIYAGSPVRRVRDRSRTLLKHEEHLES